MKHKKPYIVVAVLLAILSGIAIVRYVQAWQAEARAKTTVTRMRQFMAVLHSEKPDDVESSSLRPLLVKYNRQEVELDGWHNPLVIELQASPDDGSRHYRLTSLGKDGKRGGCCTRSVHGDWNADAVLLDDQWLQAW